MIGNHQRNATNVSLESTTVSNTLSLLESEPRITEDEEQPPLLNSRLLSQETVQSMISKLESPVRPDTVEDKSNFVHQEIEKNLDNDFFVKHKRNYLNPTSRIYGIALFHYEKDTDSIEDKMKKAGTRLDVCYFDSDIGRALETAYMKSFVDIAKETLLESYKAGYSTQQMHTLISEEQQEEYTLLRMHLAGDGRHDIVMLCEGRCCLDYGDWLMLSIDYLQAAAWDLVMKNKRQKKETLHALRNMFELYNSQTKTGKKVFGDDYGRVASLDRKRMHFDRDLMGLYAKGEGRELENCEVAPSEWMRELEEFRAREMPNTFEFVQWLRRGRDLGAEEAEAERSVFERVSAGKWETRMDMWNKTLARLYSHGLRYLFSEHQGQARGPGEDQEESLRVAKMRIFGGVVRALGRNLEELQEIERTQRAEMKNHEALQLQQQQEEQEQEDAMTWLESNVDRELVQACWRRLHNVFEKHCWYELVGEGRRAGGERAVVKSRPEERAQELEQEEMRRKLVQLAECLNRVVREGEAEPCGERVLRAMEETGQVVSAEVVREMMRVCERIAKDYVSLSLYVQVKSEGKGPRVEKFKQVREGIQSRKFQLLTSLRLLEKQRTQANL